MPTSSAPSTAVLDVSPEGVERVPTVDLFAGAGGLSLGLGRAGFVPVVASEMDVDAIATYRAAHEQYYPGVKFAMLEGDIAEHSFKHLHGSIGLVAGGPPCQPYSLGGLRQGVDDARDGIPEYVRAIREIEPEMFLMENVPGLARGTQLPRLTALLTEFRSLGYVVHWCLLHAADFGVSQRRQRLFIVGSKHPGFAWPTSTHGADAPLPWVHARTLLDPSKPIGSTNAAIVTYAKRPDLRPSAWDGHLWNGGGRPINPDGLVPTLLASMGGNKTPWLDGANVVPAYHAHLIAGGAARAGLVPGARRITAQEAALVQGFPADMPWQGKASSRYRQIGNAVPVRLAEAIGSAIMAHKHPSAAEAEARQVAFYECIEVGT